MRLYKHPRGYLSCVNEEGKLVLHHRYVWEEANGPIPKGYQIDHINGDRADNRIENLRLVTPSENQMNVKLRDNNTSGVTGVFWDKRTSAWCAACYVDGKSKHLGRFRDWFDAVCARKSADNRYGYHVNHGRRT